MASVKEPLRGYKKDCSTFKLQEPNTLILIMTWKNVVNDSNVVDTGL